MAKFCFAANLFRFYPWTPHPIAPLHRVLITVGKWNLLLKTKMTKTSIQRRLWRNFIQSDLVVPIFIHSIWLLFEGNAFLKCVHSSLTSHSTVFQSNHDDVWLLQGAKCELGGPIYTYNLAFPCAFVCLSFTLMAVDFSRTQMGYSHHLFSLYYIVIDLEEGQYFVGGFKNLDYMHY